MTTPYRVILADPPWKLNDQLPGKGRGASKKYNTMRWEDIALLELPPLADNCLLFMWRLASMQSEALAVMHAWGFDVMGESIWVKVKNGIPVGDDLPRDESHTSMKMGWYWRNCHEVCLVGKRGKGASMIKNHSIPSVFFAEVGEHSAKPTKFYDMIEKLVDGEGPFIELFGRNTHAGWSTLGDSLGTTIPLISQ